MYQKICRLKQKIENKHELWQYLRIAMEIELSTIPTYLSALYSIKPGTNQPAYNVIQSVVIEEMLHLTLAANVLNAVSGPNPLGDGPPMQLPAVEVNNPEFVPTYPTELPDADIDNPDGKPFLVPLQRFSPAAIDVFLRIELPDGGGEPPNVEGWKTIGQFYGGLMQGLDDLVCEFGAENVFDGDPNLQIQPTDYYGGAGEVVVIDGSPEERHKKAIAALQEIVDQGEGIHDSVFDGDKLPCKRATGCDTEVPAHYFRFQEIQLGRYYKPGDSPGKPTGDPLLVDWDAVFPMQENPSMKDYPNGSPEYDKLLEFNQAYVTLLNELQAAFNGEQGRFMKAVGGMYDLKYKAIALMKIPSGKDDGTTIGPGFEFVSN